MVWEGCGLNQDWSGENKHVVSVQMIVWLKFSPCGKVCPYYQLHLSSESKWKSRRSRCLLWFHHHLTSPARLHFNALLYRCAIKNIQPPRPFTALLPAIHRVASEGTLTPSWQNGALKAVMKYWSPELTDSHKKSNGAPSECRERGEVTFSLACGDNSWFQSSASYYKCYVQKNQSHRKNILK